MSNKTQITCCVFYFFPPNTKCLSEIRKYPYPHGNKIRDLTILIPKRIGLLLNIINLAYED
jgi:hypothetical protein